MKKTPKKLRLDAQTIHLLTGAQLGNVAGGATHTQVKTECGTCNCGTTTAMTQLCYTQLC